MIQSSPTIPADIAYRKAVESFGEQNYDALEKSRRRNGYFHRYLARLIGNQVMPNAKILDVGCASGDLLAALKPARGVGIDINARAIEEARKRHPELTFQQLAVEEAASLNETFDYVIISGVLQQIYDLHTVLEALRSVCHDRTRIIIVTYSQVWRPVIQFAECMGRKIRVPDESWIPSEEVANLLTQCDYDIVRQQDCILLPMGIPLVSNIINRWLAPLPGFRWAGLCTLTVARMLPRANRSSPAQSVSVLIPARNEAGNIQILLDRIPQMAERQEIVFVEGNSTDNTWEVIQNIVANYRGPYQLKALKQPGKGKGDAVRCGFAACTGDILMILDADISVPPEELPRFVNLLTRGQCEFANGSRLVYPMEKLAMQFLNMIANKLFGVLFTYLLGQSLRDTLCGTKVLRKSDYDRIAANRYYFGDFDPFGDFDLLFGAARMNLRIVDVPVHYKQRIYGSTNISRFRHGLLLFRMCWIAARKIKFV